ncbi:hypothetical protein TNCV_3942621 [Trichonephila clavipes]|nr:hypothetical protein TNCV_3942621 [Trichonephila clavipes]
MNSICSVYPKYKKLLSKTVPVSFCGKRATFGKKGVLNPDFVYEITRNMKLFLDFAIETRVIKSEFLHSKCNVPMKFGEKNSILDRVTHGFAGITRNFDAYILPSTNLCGIENGLTGYLGGLGMLISLYASFLEGMMIVWCGCKCSKLHDVQKAIMEHK